MKCTIDFDVDVWAYGMMYESIVPPPFYPPNFELKADELVQNHFNMNRKDIDKDTCINVYKFLLNCNIMLGLVPASSNC